jgi:hypothetical protein
VVINLHFLDERTVQVLQKKKKKSLSKRLLAFIGLTRQDNTMCHNPILDCPQNYLILLKIKRN